MNIVLYTRDMEPITVIDLPMWALELAQSQRRVAIQLIDDCPFSSHPDDAINTYAYRVVVLEFHKLVLPGEGVGWLATTRDDELALRLRPSWLPGQRRSINEYEHSVRTLSLALVKALSSLGGGGANER